jgi:DNA-binding SARP family transcriptional activator
MELGISGPLQVRQDGAPVTIPGAKPRAILTILGLHNGSVVSADTLIELLWGDDPPRTADKSGLRPLPPGGTKSCGKA